MKTRKLLLVIFIATMLVAIGWGVTLFIQQSPLVDMNKGTSSASWLMCPSVQGNQAGDTLSICITGTDTTIDLSHEWLRNKAVESIAPGKASPTEGSFRTYYTRTIGDGVGFKACYIKPPDVPAVQLAVDSLAARSSSPDLSTWGFVGRDIALIREDGLLLSRVHFNAHRRGELQIRRVNGATRIRIVL